MNLNPTRRSGHSTWTDPSVVSLTEATRLALAERLARHGRPARPHPMRAAAQRLQERLAALTVVDPTAGAERVVDALEPLAHRVVAVGTVPELSLVLQPRFGSAGDVLVDELVRDLRLEVVACDDPQLALARDGARRFGKGRHLAALNFGDPFAYALAADRALPLLVVGDVFPHTDGERLAM